MRKYKNQPCELDGYKFDSELELECYNRLKLALSQTPYIVKAHNLAITLTPPGNAVAPNNKFRAIVWKPDLTIYHVGRGVDKLHQPSLVIETKGYETPEFVLKMNLASRLTIWDRVVFCYKSQRSAYKSKMRKYGAIASYPELLHHVVLRKLEKLEVLDYGQH